jgi:hypothetical protein
VTSAKLKYGQAGKTPNHKKTEEILNDSSPVEWYLVPVDHEQRKEPPSVESILKIIHRLFQMLLAKQLKRNS